MELPLKPYERKKENSRKGTILNVIIVFLIIIIAIQIVFSLTFTRVYVIENSMSPTLTGAIKAGVKGGDYVLCYDGEPDYGKIVVVQRYDETDDEYNTLIKRVIALGGDTIYLDHGDLYIKYKGTDEFVLVEESYVKAENNSANYLKNTFPRINGKLDTSGHTVAEGCVFLMGDNRDYSIDSRDYGDFSVNEIVGIVADWSVSCKKILTAWYTFWDYTLPGIFS